MGDDLTASILEDYRTADIREPLKQMLGYLEKLTLTPDEVGPEDITDLREQGLSDTAIREAVWASALFNTLDRLADTFNFYIPDKSGFDMGAANLIRRGYKII